MVTFLHADLAKRITDFLVFGGVGTLCCGAWMVRVDGGLFVGYS